MDLQRVGLDLATEKQQQTYIAFKKIKFVKCDNQSNFKKQAKKQENVTRIMKKKKKNQSVEAVLEMTDIRIRKQKKRKGIITAFYMLRC